MILDDLRREHLIAQVEGIRGCLMGLGAHGTTIAAPAWLIDLITRLLRETEENLLDSDFLENLVPGWKEGAKPSQLVAQTKNCWEIGILLNLASNGIRTFLGQPEGSFGFGPRGRSQSEN